MKLLAEKLIWSFRKADRVTSAILVQGGFLQLDGTTFAPEPDSLVNLWHPVLATVDEVMGWRNFMLTKQIRQPIKQAFREVYLLTEAEERTATYSNRFAGHILKTNNLFALAPQRNWDFKYRHHETGPPTLPIPAYGMEAYYELMEAEMYSLSLTLKVAFRAKSNSHPNPPDKPLNEIPPVVFSEVMRDVDLFVSVTSIGSDPNWIFQDNQHTNYWHNFAFGKQSETTSAQSRKELLKVLIPKTKIARKCSFEDNFLVVAGNIRTYKINFGSGNILMKPNDQYLCIVPAPKDQQVVTERVWLPFEGDSILTIILSKAFLLADDDKIKDSSILSQINRI